MSRTPQPPLPEQQLPDPRLYANIPQQSLFTAPFVRILAVQLAFGVSYSTFLLLPKFLRQELHAGPDAIGVLSGASVLWAALCSPFVGMAARRASRRALLGLALLLEGLSASLFVFVDEVGTLVYVLRACQGVAWVLLFNCTATLVADTAPHRQLARAVGFLGVSMLITNALAPLLTEPLAAHFGWATVFVLAGFCSLTSLILVPRLPRDGTMAEESLPSKVFSPSTLTLYYGSLVMGAGIGVMFTFVQPFALEQGASEIGAFFLGYVPAALFVRTILGHWSDRFGHIKVSLGSLVLYSLVVGLASRLTPSTLALYGAGLGFAHGFLYPALTATGLSQATPRMRSVFMGWFVFAFNAGFAIAVFVLGQVAKQTGYSPIFLITSSVILSAVVPLFLVYRPWRPLPLASPAPHASGATT